MFCCRADIARSMAAESVSKQCVYLYIYTFFIVCFNRVCIYMYIYICILLLFVSGLWEMKVAGAGT